MAKKKYLNGGLIDSSRGDILGQTSRLGPNAASITQLISNPRTGGARVFEDVDYQKYSKYIDRPFSLSEENIDDTRALGQPFGEKLGHMALKLPVRIFANVAGATYGLFDGASEVGKDYFENGPSGSTFNQFFNNDFQRSLDSLNKWMDDKLPHYYTSYEQEFGVGKAAFGPGWQNFWTDQFAQGFSFVAGAVLSEMTMRTGI